ncbi:MAG: VacJ family lipoprotein [Mariprofundus sp.]|nr:VacJ family lipoprotein [Mariprofundus sp.]
MKSTSILVLLLALMLSACATTQNSHDPIQPVNRATDTVNDSIDRVTLKPLAQGYSAAVPKPMRTAVTNFYDNATYMNTVLNGFLQGKGAQGSQDFMRFLINTILGIGGLVDVATPMGFERHDEDFGQTLAVWGVSQGAYIVYPLLGPNSLRNTPDFITATATDPLFWAGLVIAPYVTIPVTALKYIDKRAQLLDASSMRDELALDPYVFTREAYRQNRNFLIHDGHPPAPAVNEDDDWEEDDFDLEDSNNNTQAADEFTDELDNIDATDTPINANKHTKLEHAVDKNSAMNSSMKTRISLNNAAPADMTPTNANSTIVAAAGSEVVNEDSNGQIAAAANTEHHTTVTPSGQANYSIYLSSHYSELEAASEQGHFAKIDIQTTIVPVTIKQHVWYRLLASKHHNRAEALARLKMLRSTIGLSNAWLEVRKAK